MTKSRIQESEFRIQKKGKKRKSVEAASALYSDSWILDSEFCSPSPAVSTID
jgi:hypothetical protein